MPERMRHPAAENYPLKTAPARDLPTTARQPSINERVRGVSGSKLPDGYPYREGPMWTLRFRERAAASMKVSDRVGCG